MVECFYDLLEYLVVFLRMKMNYVDDNAKHHDSKEKKRNRFKGYEWNCSTDCLIPDIGIKNTIFEPLGDEVHQWNQSKETFDRIVNLRWLFFRFH